MNTEKDLRRKYSELLFAKQNEQRYPVQKGYVKEREKIERHEEVQEVSAKTSNKLLKRSKKRIRIYTML